MAQGAKQQATSGQSFFLCVTCVCLKEWPRVVYAEAYWLVGTWSIEARCYPASLCYLGGDDLEGTEEQFFHGSKHCNP